MLDENILLVGILGSWILSAIFYYLLKQRRRGLLPNGSIERDFRQGEDLDDSPGTFWSKLGLITAMAGNRLTIIAIVLFSIFRLWTAIPLFLTIPLPLWGNWIGLLGIWFHYAWDTAVLYYNVNYTPAYKSMPPKFVLATGGPYSIVRHPSYVVDFLFTIFLFLTTGWWLLGISAIGWIALPRQAAEEEKALLTRFGDVYEDYANRTNRFIPRIRKKSVSV